MDRRDFLKNSATAAIAGAAMAIPGVDALASGNAGPADKTPADGIAYRLKYNKDGKIKILQFTDTHYIEGDERSERALRNVIQMLDTEKPDFVILGGDITDDYTSRAEMEETYRLFGELGVPVYYIDGNHEVIQHAEYLRDGLPYTQQELHDAIERNGIIILKDAYVELAPDLLLLGREDAASDARADALPNPSPERYLLVADHQPGSMQEHAADYGADLQLSGHTHAGQLFPLKGIYTFFTFPYGEYTSGSMTMFVSAGASGWRVPFRTDGHCHFEVVTLRPEQA